MITITRNKFDQFEIVLPVTFEQAKRAFDAMRAGRFLDYDANDDHGWICDFEVGVTYDRTGENHLNAILEANHEGDDALDGTLLAPDEIPLQARLDLAARFRRLLNA